MAETQNPQAGTEVSPKSLKGKTFKLDRDGLVNIKHGKAKGKAKVLPESVPAWVRRGWDTETPEEAASEQFVVVVDTESNTGKIVSPESQK